MDHLPRGSPDEDVFKLAAGNDWFLVTQDARIRRNPHQRRALLQAGIGAFILTGRADRSVEEMMILLLERFPEILRVAAQTRPPFIFGIADRGRVERLT